jgi:hypothetical protein
VTPRNWCKRAAPWQPPRPPPPHSLSPSHSRARSRSLTHSAHRTSRRSPQRNFAPRSVHCEARQPCNLRVSRARQVPPSLGESAGAASFTWVRSRAAALAHLVVNGGRW